MRVSTVVGHGVGVILSCGISQAVGVVGLIVTAVKAIWNARQLAACEAQLKIQSRIKDEYSYEVLRQRVIHHNTLNERYKKYAWTFFRIMCPVIGVPLVYQQEKYALARVGVFPNEGVTLIEKLESYKVTLDKVITDYINFKNRWLGESTQVMTPDGRELEIDWFRGFRANPNDKTIILFHGNASNKYELVNEADRYLRKGYNVVLFTLSGFPGTFSRTPMSEITATYDALAVAKFVLETKGVPPNKLLTDGLSLGSTLAMAVGAYINNTHVYTRQALSSLNAVMQISTELAPDYLKLTARELIEGAFPAGIRFPHRVTILEREIDLVTDGLNNVRKVQMLTGRYFASATREDPIMTRSDTLQAQREQEDKGEAVRDTADGVFTKSLSYDLVSAYRRSHPEFTYAQLYMTYAGNHVTSLPEYERGPLNAFLAEALG